MSQVAPTHAGTFALLTGAGPAAIATIRVTCDRTQLDQLQQVLQPLGNASLRDTPLNIPRRGTLRDESDTPIDDVLFVILDHDEQVDVRIHLHGSPYLARVCCSRLRKMGFCEEAEPALVWSHTSMLEQEAYSLLPQMRTKRGATWFLSQVEQWQNLVSEIPRIEPNEVHAYLVKASERCTVPSWFATPVRVAIVGPPNAGKSTLLNALAARRIALVSNTPGTTRDWIEAEGEADGFPVTWIDTAGVRETAEPIEAEGIARTRARAAAADVILLLLDVTADSFATDIDHWRELNKPLVVALNKIDLIKPAKSATDRIAKSVAANVIPISAKCDESFAPLFSQLLTAANRDCALLEGPAAFTARQRSLIAEMLQLQNREELASAGRRLIGDECV